MFAVMSVIRVIVGVILGIISLYCIRHNGHIKWDVWVRRVDPQKDNYEKGETVPFLGGITGALAMLCLTGGHKPWLALIPAILDYGTIPMLLYVIGDLLGIFKK